MQSAAYLYWRGSMKHPFKEVPIHDLETLVKGVEESLANLKQVASLEQRLTHHTQYAIMYRAAIESLEYRISTLRGVIAGKRAHAPIIKDRKKEKARMYFDPWAAIELSIAVDVANAKHDIAMKVGAYRYEHGYFNMADVHAKFPQGRYKHQELIEFLGTTTPTKVELPPFEEGKYVREWKMKHEIEEFFSLLK